MPVIPAGTSLLQLDNESLLALAQALDYMRKIGRSNANLERIRCEVVPMARQQWDTPAAYRSPDMTTRGAAAWLGLSTRRIQQLASQGILKGHRIENNTWRFTNEDVEKYGVLYPH
jgi:excisionase family DNA binding protein